MTVTSHPGTDPGTHPVTAATALIDAALRSVAHVNPGFLPTAAKADALREIVSLESRLVELRLRIMATADDVAETTAARDVAAWLSHQTRSRSESTRADARLADALDRRHLLLAAALRDGLAHRDQAQVIVRALDKLPAEVEDDVRHLAEKTLVGHCADLTPAELAQVGKRVLEHVAPEVAEEALRRQLDDEEESALQKQRLHLQRMGDGTTRIGGLITDAAATRLAQVLGAFANPRKHATPAADLHPQDDPAVEAFMRLPYPRRLAEAFATLMESLDPARLPVHGGDATTLVVTMRLSDLRDELARRPGRVVGDRLPGDDSAASIERLSAAEVRRLACAAQIVPAVLGTDSEVLDLGRKGRLFSAAQRRAMLLRDRTCRAEGCDIPGSWSEGHHWVPWSQGGASDLDNGVLLCRHHHMRAHDPAYSTERLANGDVRYARRR